MNKIGVMHVVDTLALGGAERAAVDLVNHLPRSKYRPYLCSTRTEGPLSDSVKVEVGRIALNRSRTFAPSALRIMVNFIRDEQISILHAHGSSLFIAALAATFRPFPTVIWHAHYGRMALENRRAVAHRIASHKIKGVITVNRQLADWCRQRLHVSANRIWYIPNMVCTPERIPKISNLPGNSGYRIVCVANLRPEKDHLNLIRAMAEVVKKQPKAHLLLVGAYSNPVYSAEPAYFQAVQGEIERFSLTKNVTVLGQRADVPSVLQACDIAVLSSKTEGLPVSLLEYGMAGLPVIATRVGECEEVLDGGDAGIVVPPNSPQEFAKALLTLLDSPERRAALGNKFSGRVRQFYNASSVIEQVCEVYDVTMQLNKWKPDCLEPIREVYRT